MTYFHLIKYYNNTMFNISDIVIDEKQLEQYINHMNLNKKPTVRETLSHAREICSGLPSEADIAEELKNDKNTKDKGLFGKIIEYGLFGQKPNSNSSSDLLC